MLQGTVDICIMAHPSRADNVAKIQQALNLSDDSVFWDDRINGGDAMYTARKAWQSPIPENCTHRLVLQDDIEVCVEFCNFVEKAARKHPNSIVTFFHCEEYITDQRYHNDPTLWGCAIMIPVKLLDNLWWFVDNRMEVYAKPQLDEILKRDTSCIRVWMRNKHIPCVTTVPSLVQHIGDNSLVGINRRRVALDFTMNPPLTGW